MGRCKIQIVMGPAGSGKSTYCHVLQQHAQTFAGTIRQRTIHVANLDPAAEIFHYTPIFDIRDVISVTEVMQELQLGPNGALVYCMEYLTENLDWLREQLDTLDDDEYLILDCPGQLELYTHVPVMRTIIDAMRLWGYEGSMVSVFCIDSAFVIDLSKFLSGSLLSLSAMIALELPHVNVLTKSDLIPSAEMEHILSQSASQLWYREQDPLYGNFESDRDSTTAASTSTTTTPTSRTRRRDGLTEAICQLLEDYSMVSFIPLNIRDEDSIDHVLSTCDHAVQYGEDVEVRGTDLELDYTNGTAGGNEE
jgi:GTPase SAR1 family protein